MENIVLWSLWSSETPRSRFLDDNNWIYWLLAAHVTLNLICFPHHLAISISVNPWFCVLAAPTMLVVHYWASTAQFVPSFHKDALLPAAQIVQSKHTHSLLLLCGNADRQAWVPEHSQKLRWKLHNLCICFAKMTFFWASTIHEKPHMGYCKKIMPHTVAVKWQ